MLRLVKRERQVRVLVCLFNIFVGVAYILRGFVHYCHDVEWQHAGRHGTGEVAENFPSYWQYLEHI